MSTTRGDAEQTSAPDAAARLREAGFVRILAPTTGDGAAAAGVLARVLADRSIPFQASLAPTAGERERRVQAADDREDDVTVLVGDGSAPDAVPVSGPVASATAWEIAAELGDPDPTLALAGCVAAGLVPGEGVAADPLAAASVERRPGVAGPTDDPVETLAHSTLVHGSFSGDREAAEDALRGIVPTDADFADPDVGRAVASLVAIEATGDDAPAAAAAAVERALRPHAPGGPFATVEGYADVLDATAREAPGTAVALALGHDVADAAVETWRDYGARTHEAVRAARTGRYDGLLAARVDGDAVGAVARLLADYRSPEPVVLVVGDRAAAAFAREEGRPVGAAMAAAASAVDGAADGRGRAAHATIPRDPDVTAFISAFREVIS